MPIKRLPPTTRPELTKGSEIPKRTLFTARLDKGGSEGLFMKDYYGAAIHCLVHPQMSELDVWTTADPTFYDVRYDPKVDVAW
jgi:hypothetical protein